MRQDDIEERVKEVVKSSFKPEFINRLDEIILFQRLFESDMKAIVEIQLEILRRRLEGMKISISVSPEAVLWLAKEGYDSAFGARPLKRVIQRYLENEIANLILESTVIEQGSIKVDMKKEALSIKANFDNPSKNG